MPARPKGEYQTRCARGADTPPKCTVGRCDRSSCNLLGGTLGLDLVLVQCCLVFDRVFISDRPGSLVCLLVQVLHCRPDLVDFGLFLWVHAMRER